MPEVGFHFLTDEAVYILLGCDGLFEGSDGDMYWIGEEVQSSLEQGHEKHLTHSLIGPLHNNSHLFDELKGKTPLQICKHLVATAYAQGSTDNITAVLCPINVQFGPGVADED